MITIDKKITGWSLVKPDEPAPTPTPDPEQMHEKIKRPETLPGSTYKIRTPLSEHALYVTINDVVLGRGTDHEHRRPFEIFINSKNMDHFQWTVALTRILSAVFRKGGIVAFLVDELCSVYDPRGGYLRKGGYVPSLVAEIGLVEVGLMAAPGRSAGVIHVALVDREFAHREIWRRPARTRASRGLRVRHRASLRLDHSQKIDHPVHLPAGVHLSALNRHPSNRGFQFQRVHVDPGDRKSGQGQSQATVGPIDHLDVAQSHRTFMPAHDAPALGQIDLITSSDV
jgi:hypothetical protein